MSKERAVLLYGLLLMSRERQPKVPGAARTPCPCPRVEEGWVCMVWLQSRATAEW